MKSMCVYVGVNLSALWAAHLVSAPAPPFRPIPIWNSIAAGFSPTPHSLWHLHPTP